MSQYIFLSQPYFCIDICPIEINNSSFKIKVQGKEGCTLEQRHENNTDGAIVTNAKCNNVYFNLIYISTLLIITRKWKKSQNKGVRVKKSEKRI